MIQYEQRIDIDAPPEGVWTIIADVARWPEWTDSISRVERLDSGEFGGGSEARLWTKGGPPAVWRVTDFDPPRSFTWASKSGGVRTLADHEVVARDGGATVTLRVRYSGVMATVLRPMLSWISKRNLRMEATGLKRRSEAG